ncbi:MAG: hypothetical protein ACRDKV_10760 [Solirubrobacterales bacterium]
MSGLAATLREAEPGTRVRLILVDGSEVSGALRGVNGETVDLDKGSFELRQVKRLRLDLSTAPRGPQRQAA